MSETLFFARSVEARFCKKGLEVGEARRQVARKLRMGVGSFANMIKDRADLWRRADEAREHLRLLLVSELKSEIARLQTELANAERAGNRLSPARVGAIEAHLSAASELLSLNEEEAP